MLVKRQAIRYTEQPVQMELINISAKQQAELTKIPVLLQQPAILIKQGLTKRSVAKVITAKLPLL